MLGKIALAVNASLAGVTRPEPSGMPPSHSSTARLENVAVRASEQCGAEPPAFYAECARHPCGQRPRSKSVRYGSMRGHAIASVRTAVAIAIAYSVVEAVSSERPSSERLPRSTQVTTIADAMGVMVPCARPSHASAPPALAATTAGNANGCTQRPVGGDCTCCRRQSGTDAALLAPVVPFSTNGLLEDPDVSCPTGSIQRLRMNSVPSAARFRRAHDRPFISAPHAAPWHASLPGGLVSR
jgi:hypothetical protein